MHPKTPPPPLDSTLLSRLPLPPFYRTLPDGGVEPVTRTEYKAEMHDKFTVRRAVNPQCGHKVVVGHEPRHKNCETCWFAYFQIHGEVTKLADQIYQENGYGGAQVIITQLKGRKFFENFLKFMSTVAKWKADIEAAKEQEQESQDERHTRTTETVGGDVDTASSSTDPGV